MVKYYLSSFYRELKLLLARFVVTFQYCLPNLLVLYPSVLSLKKDACWNLNMLPTLWFSYSSTSYVYVFSQKGPTSCPLFVSLEGVSHPLFSDFGVSIQMVGCPLILFLSWVFFLVMKFLLKKFHILPLKSWKSVYFLILMFAIIIMHKNRVFSAF